MTASTNDVSDEQQPAPIGELLAHMHARRHGAMWIFCLIFVGALTLAALLPPRYRATASLAIMPSPEFTVREDAGSHAYNNSALAMDQIMKAETEILESDELHEGAIRDILEGTGHSPEPDAHSGIDKLYPDLRPAGQSGPVWDGIKAGFRIFLSPWRGYPTPGRDAALEEGLKRFSKDLRVLPAKDSNVISVSFTHHDAELSARTLNVMLTRYAARRRTIYNDPQLAVAQHAADEAAILVRHADLALTAFKALRGYSDYGTERDLLLRRRSQAEQVVADANAADLQSQARLATIETETHRLPDSLSLYREDNADTRLQSVNEKLQDLSGQLAVARLHYRDNSRVVTSLQAQINLQLAEKRRIAQDSTPSVLRSGRSPALDPLLIDRAHAVADRDVARVQAVIVQQQVESLRNQLSKLNGDESTFADLTRQKAAADESFVAANRAAAEQRLTEAEDTRRLANIRIIQPARVPLYPTPTKLIVCVAGFLLAALTACCWILIKFMTNTTFLTAAGLATATGFPVLAVIQRVKHPIGAE